MPALARKPQPRTSRNGIAGKEKPKHLRIFHMFFHLGVDRTYAELADVVSDRTPEEAPTRNTLKHWGSRWRWVQRAKEMDEKAVVIAMDQSVQCRARMIKQDIGIIDIVIKRFEKYLEDEDACPIKSVTDYEKAVKLRLLLQSLQNCDSNPGDAKAQEAAKAQQPLLLLTPDQLFDLAMNLDANKVREKAKASAIDVTAKPVPS